MRIRVIQNLKPHALADSAPGYERVAQAMAVAQQAGQRNIGLITEPKTKESML
jgi:biopolymer transport protein ExbD